MSTEDNKAVIRHLIDGLNQHNVAVLDEVCTSDFVFHDPNNPQVQSREDFKQWMTELYAAFPDLRFSLESILAEGDRVAYRYTFHATHRGSWQGMAPTGKSIAITGISISRFREGKSAEGWQNADSLGMVQQLGVVPAPAQTH